MIRPSIVRRRLVMGEDTARHDDVVAVAGPAPADGDHDAALRADDDVGAATAPVVLADRG
jgi:hypothetical protein